MGFESSTSPPRKGDEDGETCPFAKRMCVTALRVRIPPFPLSGCKSVADGRVWGAKVAGSSPVIPTMDHSPNGRALV